METIEKSDTQVHQRIKRKDFHQDQFIQLLQETYNEIIKFIESGDESKLTDLLNHLKKEIEGKQKFIANQQKAKRQDIESLALEFIKYFNFKTNRYFRVTNDVKRSLKRWTTSGYKLEDFKLVIDYQFYQWFDNPDMKNYITPETLLRISNFERYLQRARNDDDYLNSVS